MNRIWMKMLLHQFLKTLLFKRTDGPDKDF
jgi:hypothetical protein